MTDVLVVVETRRGELRDVSLELLRAASDLRGARVSGRVLAAVIDADPHRFAPELPADEVLCVTTPLEHFEAHITQQAVEALLASERPGIVLCAHSIDALGWAPAVAARAGLDFASDVTRLTLEPQCLIAERGGYGGRFVAELVLGGDAPALCMLRAGAWDAAQAPASPAPVRDVAVDWRPAPTEHVAFHEAPAGDVDITKADFLLSVGRGVEDRDDLERLGELADRLGATLTVSRPLVDAGWMPSARQVGQSGKTVRPKVYLALGISGAVQHLAGMQRADTIIAVNTDPGAPIFKVAHYGAIADLLDVADALEARL